jgi:hypothetical protein
VARGFQVERIEKTQFFLGIVTIFEQPPAFAVEPQGF